MSDDQTIPFDPDILQRLSRSKFRSRFRLGGSERVYAMEKGRETIAVHARDFIATRIARAEPKNDGRQTPMRGHPVFVAQHATATCLPRLPCQMAWRAGGSRAFDRRAGTDRRRCHGVDRTRDGEAGMSTGTPATQMLKKAKVAFRTAEYDYVSGQHAIGMHAAEAIGADPDRVLKTLMVEVDGKPACAVIPADRTLSMKRVAAAFGGKSAAMMPPGQGGTPDWLSHRRDQPLRAAKACADRIRGDCAQG